MKYLLFLAVLLIYACASVQSLEGGIKDEIPPRVIKTSTDSASINVAKNSFIFSFDEYVRLNKVSELLLISPNQKKKPTTVIKGKKLYLTLNDSLMPSTTYTIQFNGSIVDINEANPLNDYVFIFSTGSYIDSLSINGYVKDIKTNKPCEDCNVQLYLAQTDSIVYTDKPDYLAKTNKTGNYNIPNLPDTTFKLIAIRDLNKNLILNEEEYISLSKQVSTNQEEIDSLSIFPIASTQPYKPKLISKRPGITQFIFNKPLLDKLEFQVNNKPVSYLTSPTKDTITVYQKPLNDTTNILLIIEQDSFHYKSIHNLESLKYKLRLEVKNSYVNTIINSKTPILSVNKNLINLYRDSTIINIDTVEIINQTVSLKYKGTPPNKVVFQKGAITDLLNHSNDSINKLLEIPKLTNSNLILNINTDTSIYLFELYKEDKILKRQIIVKSTILTFNNLQPGEYSCILIKDINKNEIWDTGDFLQQKSPEPIQFSDPFKMRENWDKELTINSL